MRITIDDFDVRRDIQNLKKSIPEASAKGGHAALKVLAEKLRDRIRELIPDEGGWYDLYKQSIELIEVDRGHYEITTTVQEIKFGKIEAASSVLWVTGGDTFAKLLSTFNPWTLDTLPAVKGGIKCDLIMKAGSDTEVEILRRKQLDQRKKVEAAIRNANGVVYPLDAELPTIDGRVLADVPFLARRLEHGLGGFPRTPIWSRLDAEGNILAKDKAVQRRGHLVFDDYAWPKE